MQRVDYDELLFGVYDKGRAMTAEAGRLWMDVVRRHLAARRVQRVLDLGSGTGRFSALLADAFNAKVLAVEPSAQMRAEAAKRNNLVGIRIVDGRAEAIPANDGESIEPR